MNTSNSPTRLVANDYPVTRPAATRDVQASRRYRERDFGVGYGASSGYASARRYADSRGAVLSRCK